MGKVRIMPEKTIGKLYGAEAFLGQGANIEKAIRKVGVSEKTCYYWRRKYGGMWMDQAQRLKKLAAAVFIIEDSEY